MKRMLFNATHAEETRVGIVDGQKLIDIDIETVGREARKSNIYRGIVTRIEPSLEACFVNYGEERHGFLPFKEISRSYFKEGVDVRSTTIREAITEGQELIVQVEKEERGNKGAALTTFISLAGRYLVLMPNNPRGGGVSRRIEGEERQELREAMEKLDIPRGMSTIARTAGIGRTTEELQWDLNYLLKLWNAISKASEPQYELVKNENGRRTTVTVNTPVVDGKPLKRTNPPPYLIVEESNLVVRAIRDYFQDDIGEVLVDTDEIYDQARQFMAHVMPDMIGRVKRYREDIPLFTRFQIEHQIETAYSRTVPLPSGGAIVIDHTEALVAIDVNSARATRGADIEETAFRTNCEAADEVARQMRLRDLGGLIVIDFIDMADSRNQRAVEQRLKDALRYDRARVQMAKISRFGLMELSRQRLRPALSEGNHITCPRCNGVGVIRDTESCALQVLRILQEEAMKEGTGAVHAQVPVDVATFLLNEKRNDVMKLEARHRVPIVLIPNMHLETPHYHIERLRQDDDRLEDTTASFKRVEDIEETKADDPYALKSNEDKPVRPKQVPVIKNVLPREPAPTHVEHEKRSDKSDNKAKPVAEKKGFLTRLFEMIFGSSDEEEKKDKKKSAGRRKKSGEGRDHDKRRSRRDGRRSRRADHGERSEERQDDKKRRDRSMRRAEETEKETHDNNEHTSRRRRSRRRPAEQQNPVTDEVTAIVDTAAEKVSEEAVQKVHEKAEKPESRDLAEHDAETAVRKDNHDDISEEGDDSLNETRRRRPRRRRRSKPANEASATEMTPAVKTEAEKEASPVAEEAVREESLSEEVKAPVEEKPESVQESSPAANPEKPEVKAEEKVSQPDAADEPVLVQIETTAPTQPDAYRDEKPVGRPQVSREEKAEEEPLVQIETKSAPEAETLKTVVTMTDVASRLLSEAPEKSERRTRRSRRNRSRRNDIPVSTALNPIAEAVAEIVADPVIVAARPAVKTVETPVVEVKAEAVKTEAPVEPVEVKSAAAEEAPVAEAAAAEVPAEEIQQEEKAVEHEEVQPEEPAAVSEDVSAEVTDDSDDVAAGLEENLIRAGLVQVHTNPEHAAFNGYELIRYTGRKVEHAAGGEGEEELVQVHTRPELCKPVDYAPVKYAGRPAPVYASSEDEGELIQVHTKTE